MTHGNVTLKVYEVNRANRTIYSVAHKEDGRRKLKQFPDIASALGWAANRAKEIDRGKAHSITLSPDDAATYQRAMQLLRGIGKPLDAVAREYVDGNDTLGGAARLDDAATYYAERRLRLDQRTVPEVVEELLEARAHKSIRHVKDLRGRLGRFKRDVTGHIANVTQRDLGLWLRGLGLSSRSHDNFRQVLVLLFRFAQKQGYLPEGRTEAEKTEAMGDNGEGDSHLHARRDEEPSESGRERCPALSGPWRFRGDQNCGNRPPGLVRNQFRHELYRDQEDQS